MRKTRYLIAVTIVATALCADRALMSRATERAETPVPTQHWVKRLSTHLGRSVATVRIVAEQQVGLDDSLQSQISSPNTRSLARHWARSLQFRLPPPLV